MRLFKFDNDIKIESEVINQYIKKREDYWKEKNVELLHEINNLEDQQKKLSYEWLLEKQQLINEFGDLFYQSMKEVRRNRLFHPDKDWKFKFPSYGELIELPQK